LAFPPDLFLRLLDLRLPLGLFLLRSKHFFLALAGLLSALLRFFPSLFLLLSFG